MDCPACGADTVAFAVPEGIREHAPDGADGVAVCTRCLKTAPTTAPAEQPDPSAVSRGLPANPDAAVAILLGASLLSSLVGNRPAIEALFGAAERRGADYRLAVERLADDPDLDPTVDLRRRLRQFESL